MKVPTLSLKAIDEWLSTLPPETLFERHSPHKCAVAAYLNENDKREDRINSDWRVGCQYASRGPATEEQIRMSANLTRFIIRFDSSLGDESKEPTHRQPNGSARKAREIIKRILTQHPAESS